MNDYYKIKLRTAGHRMNYGVEDKVLFVSEIAVGKRKKNKAFQLGEQRQGFHSSSDNPGLSVDYSPRIEQTMVIVRGL